MLLETSKMHSTAVTYKKGLPFRLQILLITVFFALLIIFLLLLVHVSWYSSNASDIAFSPKPNKYIRLPTHLRPIHYTLTLKIFLPYNRFYDFGSKNFTTEGNLRIDLICLESTSRIIMNANNLDVKMSNIRISNERGAKFGITSLQRYRHETDDIWALEFQLERRMNAHNNYSLFIKYNGLIDNVWNGGLYRVPYDSLNEKKMLAITQLQPTDASRLLPCFDEPAMKAKFSITVIHPADTTAISNAPILKAKTLDKIWKETSFEETPLMSTYLLAIAVSDFDHRQLNCGNVQIRVWSQHEKVEYVQYALQASCRILFYYEDYFSIAYPLKKLDIFAVPELRVLAMENWGLITIRQKHVLYNQQINSLRERRVVTDVLAHEIAHMWFGNLVTMKWWNDLWLNEGFASMMAPKAADFAENTTLRMSQYFAAEVSLKALSSDQHATTTQPISLKKNSDRVLGQDNKILYNKGAAVLRMVESAVGEDVFRFGLTSYLKKFKHGNANKQEFLSSFCDQFHKRNYDDTSQTNFSIYDFIDAWIYQRGFPVVNVKKNDNNHYLLSQHIFDVDHAKLYEKSMWKIPIFINGGSLRRVIWLTEWNNGTLIPIEKRPLIMDLESRGYYRIHYDDETLEEIIDQLITDHLSLPVSSRLKLLDDAFVLAEFGQISYSVPFRMSQYLRKESEVIPFIIFFARFDLIHHRVFRHPNASILNNFAQHIILPIANKIFEIDFMAKIDDIMQYEFLRELVLLKLCLTGEQRCIRALREKFDQLMVNCSSAALSSNCNKIEPSMRTSVYMVGSKYGNINDYEFLKEKFHMEIYHAERDRIFSAMAYTTNRTHLLELTHEVLFGNQDIDFRHKVFELVRKNYDNEIISDYLYQNFIQIKQRHTKYENFFLMQMTKMYGSANDLSKLEKFERLHYQSSVRQKKLLNHLKNDIQRKINWTKNFSSQLVNVLTEIMSISEVDQK